LLIALQSLPEVQPVLPKLPVALAFSSATVPVWRE
jgi:hypothetical protein